MDIADALCARSGLVCLVGADGMLTTLYALTERVPRSVVTSTVRIPTFDEHVARVAVTDTPTVELRANRDWPLGLVPERAGDSNYRGYDPSLVTAIAASDVADAVFVKGDGSRGRLFKAPNDGEPRIPVVADTAIPVVAADVVGQPLSEAAVHRPERVAAIAGLDLGDEIRAADVAAVLASPEGGLKRVQPEATVVPLVNFVGGAGGDGERVREGDTDLEAVARDVADEVLARAPRRISRVVVARMHRADPLVAVVE